MDLGLLGQVASSVGRSAVSKATEAAGDLVGRKGEGSVDEEAPLRDSTTAAESQQDWGDVLPSELEQEEPQDIRDQTISNIEFKRMVERLTREPPSVSATSATLPRRFSVKLRNFTLENLSDVVSEAPPTVFFIISVGGTTTEVRVKEEFSKKSVSRVAGYKGKVFVTPPITAAAKYPVEIPFQQSFEWRGSYQELEKEFLRFELWEVGGISLNSLLCQYEEPLRSLVDASVARTASLDTHDKRPFRLSYMMEFQEIFDFPLNFCNVRLAPVLQHEQFTEQKSEAQPQQPSLDRAVSATLYEHVTTTFAQEGSEHVGRIFENYEGSPRLRFLIRASGYNKWPLRLVSAACDPPHSLSWDYVGRITFRGTAADLEGTEVSVTVEDSIRPSKKTKELLRGTFALRDIVDVPHFAFHLEGRSKERKATMVGLCGIPFKPKYRQSGQILDIDDRNLYLFVKLLRIDKLRPQMPAEELDCYAEIEFGGDTKQTSTSHATVSPHFQSELVFSMKVADVESITPTDVESKGPIRIDVWGTSDLVTQHLGWTELYMAEILKSDQLTEEMLRPQSKRYFDRKKAKEVTYETRIFSLSRKLFVSWDSSKDVASTLYMDVWTKPDIGDLQLVTPPKTKRFTVPRELAQFVSPLMEIWSKSLQQLAHSGRQFGCLATDQRARLIPYNLFVIPLQPPPELVSAIDCLNFVRCIAFTETVGAPFNWCSPDFICKIRSGTVFHHALLLCCFLNGLKVPSFVCIGTRHDEEPYAWVLAIEQKSKTLPPSLSFWDIPENIIYKLPSTAGGHGLLGDLSGIDAEMPVGLLPPTRKPGETGKASAVGVVPTRTTDKYPLGTHATARKIKKGLRKSPFKTIDVIFNHNGIYANLQTPSPSAIRYDINNPNLWKSFYTHTPELETIFPRGSLATSPDEASARQTAQALYDGITRSIQSYRFQMSKTAGTSWNRQRSVTSFLENGMQLLAELEKWEVGTSRADEARAEFEVVQPDSKNSFLMKEWRMVLLSLTPQWYKLRWVHLSFNHSNIKVISQHLWSSVKFLTENDSSMLLSLGIYVRPMPADLRAEKRQMEIEQKEAELDHDAF